MFYNPNDKEPLSFVLITSGRFEQNLAEFENMQTWNGERIKEVRIEPPTGEGVNVTIVKMDNSEVLYKVY